MDDSMKRLQIFTKKYEFDKIIGYIEDMLIDEKFNILQKKFLESYWTEFNESEENKHVYMEIFNNYTNAIELYITQTLQSKMPNFSMESFTTDLENRRNELDGEVFDMLYTLTDFAAFKEMFLDYRKMKLYGEIDLSGAMTIVPIQPTNN